MKQPLYIIQRWPHGWVLCSPPGQEGVPMDALSEVMPLASKDAVCASGIVDSLKASGHYEACLAICSPAEAVAWEAEIAADLAGLDREPRWWRGTDKGTSSATIFAQFCSPQYRHKAAEFGKGNAPHDAADFGRCKRLIELFPEWKPRLAEVAASHPQSKWARIIAHWDEIAGATAIEANRILFNLHNAP